MKKNMNTNNKKIAFSLFEAVVVMGIVAIFVASATNVFTKKHKKQTEKPPHGRFECYYQDNKLVQQTFYENMSGQIQTLTTDYCTFKPVRRASYYVLNLVGAGGGGTSSYGGSAGTYRSFFIPTIQKELHVYPGKGTSTTGGQSFVREKLTDGNMKDLASVQGGQSGFDLESISAKHVSSCAVTKQKYACNIDAFCTIYEQYLYVTYCVAEEMSSENNEDAHAEDNVTYGDISRKGTYNSTTRKVTYDKPGITTGPSESPYTLTLDVVANTAGQDGELSEFVGYLHAIGVNSPIVTASPGSGGAKSENGKHGGAIITW